MFKSFKILMIGMLVSIILVGCSSDEATTPKDETENTNTKVEAKTAVKVGEVYKAGDLSYNIIGLEIKNDILRVNMEVYNNTDDDINFTPMTTLALVNEDGEECDWNIMVGKLSGTIMANNKIMGEVGFNIKDLETDNYVLNIGEDFELEKAIEISKDDIGKEFKEVFTNSEITSKYTVGDKIKSEGFDVLINKVSKKPSTKDGQDILLIDMSLTNNAKEERTLTFEIKGVYTSDGTKLSAEYNEWTFRNYGIETNETATGIISYYFEEGKTDFYIEVAPNISNFNDTETITFSVE